MAIFGSQHLRLPMMRWSNVTARPEAREAPTTRALDCPHCGETLRVAARAINTRCTACHRHLLLEDVVVRGDSVRTRIITCGSILIEPMAKFSGVLQGAEVVIAGRVMGTVIGTERVEVTATGKSGRDDRDASVTGARSIADRRADQHSQRGQFDLDDHGAPSVGRNRLFQAKIHFSHCLRIARGSSPFKGVAGLGFES